MADVPKKVMLSTLKTLFIELKEKRQDPKAVYSCLSSMVEAIDVYATETGWFKLSKRICKISSSISTNGDPNKNHMIYDHDSKKLDILIPEIAIYLNEPIDQ